MPYRAALKSIYTETSNTSSAALLRLPGLVGTLLLPTAPAVPEEGSRVAASTLSQPLMCSPASSCSQKLVEMQEFGKASHGEGCGDDGSAGCPLAEQHHRTLLHATAS